MFSVKKLANEHVEWKITIKWPDASSLSHFQLPPLTIVEVNPPVRVDERGGQSWWGERGREQRRQCRSRGVGLVDEGEGENQTQGGNGGCKERERGGGRRGRESEGNGSCCWWLMREADRAGGEREGESNRDDVGAREGGGGRGRGGPGTGREWRLPREGEGGEDARVREMAAITGGRGIGRGREAKDERTVKRTPTRPDRAQGWVGERKRDACRGGRGRGREEGVRREDDGERRARGEIKTMPELVGREALTMPMPEEPVRSKERTMSVDAGERHTLPVRAGKNFPTSAIVVQIEAPLAIREVVASVAVREHRAKCPSRVIQ